MTSEETLVVAGDSKNSIFSIVIQSLRNWMTGDRVRVAGSHGRALSIQPGDRLFITGRSFLVQNRTVFDDADQECARLVYDLIDQETDQATTLEVVLHKDGAELHHTVLKDGENISAICDADITIL